MKDAAEGLQIPIWIQLNKVSKKYMDALAARLAHLGIRRWYFLLVAISDAKGAPTQQQLADLLETDKVNMVAIIDMLAKAGFVKRRVNPGDRRQHLIALTPKAERALPEIRRAIADLNRAALSSLPRGLAERFPEALAAMKAGLEKAMGREPG